MRVLTVNDLGFEHRGGGLFMAYHQQKERLAGTSAAGVAGLDAVWQSRLEPSGRLQIDLVFSEQPLRRHRDRDRWRPPTAAPIVYLRRRFVPPPERFALLAEHTVSERRAARYHRRPSYLGDPEQFWRICDANSAMRPDELTERQAGGCASPCRRGFRGGTTMLKGIHLTLLVGPVVPVPVARSGARRAHQRPGDRPQPGSAAASSSRSRSATHSPLAHDLPARRGQHARGIRVILVATVNGMPQVLIDGVITQQRGRARRRPGQSTLTVTGEDLTAVMDFMTTSPACPIPAMPTEARVALILAKYAVYGIIPLVVPSCSWSMPNADRADPAPQGHRPRLHRRLLADGGRLRLLPRARAGAGHEHRLLGAGDQGRRAAAGAQRRHGRPHQRRNARASASTATGTRAARGAASRNQLTKVPIPIPIPEINPLPAAARR